MALTRMADRSYGQTSMSRCRTILSYFRFRPTQNGGDTTPWLVGRAGWVGWRQMGLGRPGGAGWGCVTLISIITPQVLQWPLIGWRAVNIILLISTSALGCCLRHTDAGSPPARVTIDMFIFYSSRYDRLLVGGGSWMIGICLLKFSADCEIFFRGLIYFGMEHTLFHTNLMSLSYGANESGF